MTRGFGCLAVLPVLCWDGGITQQWVSHLTMLHLSLRSSPGRAAVRRKVSRICLNRASVQ